MSLTSTPKITPRGEQESNRMKEGDFRDEKGIYGQAGARESDDMKRVGDGDFRTDSCGRDYCVRDLCLLEILD